MSQSLKPKYTVDQLAEGVMRSDRSLLAQAITLVESQRASDEDVAARLLDKVYHKTGQAFRLAITGSPGVGKSTFIESFGNGITQHGQRLAVLTIDPSSPVSGGSILGDKTRMEKLSQNPSVFIRPTAAASALGGVAPKTREVISLFEAAGYDFIIIETVGVGQSEITVRGMADFVVLLQLAGAGDELQGIKRGIIEIADAILITKADGANTAAARKAQAAFQQALHLFGPTPSGWQPPVLTASAYEPHTLTALWDLLKGYQQQCAAFIQKNRQTQRMAWFTESFRELIQRDLQQSASLQKIQHALEQSIRNGEIAPSSAAIKQRDAYLQEIGSRRST